MADTPRSRSRLLEIFADNTTSNITPQDLRDFVVSTNIGQIVGGTGIEINHDDGEFVISYTGEGNGPQGYQGYQGHQGYQGLQGDQGDQGNQGLQGGNGTVWKGEWQNYGSGDPHYFIGDLVTYDGSVWVAVIDNAFQNPYEDSAQWDLFSRGFRWMGDWTSGGGVYYNVADVVKYQGSAWVAVTGANNGRAPDSSPGWWQLMVEKGSQGDQGWQGNQGFQGFQGFTGDVGAQGTQGNQGDVGAQGTQGYQGLQGYTVAWKATGLASPYGAVIGNVGDKYLGSDGSIWTNGGDYIWGNDGINIRGPQGFQGDVGVQGTQGTQGFQGDVGAQGPQGFQGPQGDVGAQGTQGFQGDVGAQGPQGFQGPQGDVGAQGNQGNQGDVGAQGAQGNQGDVGAQGTQGDIIEWKVFTGGNNPNGGVAGGLGDFLVAANGSLWRNNDSAAAWTDLSLNITGPQGFQGFTGDVGAQGNQGNQGDVGAQGAQGNQGDVGAQGTQGDIIEWKVFTGGNNPNGGVAGGLGDFLVAANGSLWQNSNGATAWTDLSLNITGPQGFQGPQGDVGVQGTQGNQGFQGDVGAQGNQGFQGDVGAQGNQGFQGDGVTIVFVDNEVPGGTMNSSNDTFTLSASPNPATSLHLYLNGLRMAPTVDYTLSANTITMNAGQIPDSGDNLLADYRH